jgi:fructose-1,6-bisphosphatase/inositol monophosphatase family enzyme
MNLNDLIASAGRWLTSFHPEAVRAAEELDRRSDVHARLRELGTVEAGGDRTLEIDALAEEAVFVELEALASEGASFTAISEERGVVRYGEGTMHVVIDPIDGSMNAKRRLPHCAMSIAVADGSTIDDLAMASVWDFGAREAFHAVRGGGAFLNCQCVGPLSEERMSEDERLELLCVETSDARAIAEFAAPLAAIAYRVARSWRDRVGDVPGGHSPCRCDGQRHKMSGGRCGCRHADRARERRRGPVCRRESDAARAGAAHVALRGADARRGREAHGVPCGGR